MISTDFKSVDNHSSKYGAVGLKSKKKFTDSTMLVYRDRLSTYSVKD